MTKLTAYPCEHLNPGDHVGRVVWMGQTLVALLCSACSEQLERDIGASLTDDTHKAAADGTSVIADGFVSTVRIGSLASHAMTSRRLAPDCYEE